MKEIELTQIEGIKVGHAQNVEGGTGCTVILAEQGVCAGVDVRGGGPASRETDTLRPINMIEKIHAVMLSGGSAYGLDAAGGAMQYLEENGFGLDVGVGVVPIVCGSSLFDLTVGDAKCRPDKAMGYEACRNASTAPVAQGNVGAGTGATVGKILGTGRMMKSGLGCYAVQIGDVKCGAIVAVNAVGDVRDADTGAILAGVLSEDGAAFADAREVLHQGISIVRKPFSNNTTIGVVVTNAKLNKVQCTKVAAVAHNGFAQTIRPVHTSSDGDTIYALATGEVTADSDAMAALAAEVMAKAINCAVRSAQPAYGLKSASDFI